MQQRSKGEIVLNKFEIQRLLGKGGNGMVYLAYEATLKRYVALKEPIDKTTIGPEDIKYHSAVKRISREAELNAQFTGLPVITIFGLENDEDGTPILVMEYAERGSLLDLMKRLLSDCFTLEDLPHIVTSN